MKSKLRTFKSRLREDLKDPAFKAHYLEERQALLPTKNSWDTLIRSLDKFSDDFMTERNQPKAEKGKIKQD